MYNYLSFLLILVFCLCGIVFYRPKKVSSFHYWLILFVPIIGYGLLYGLRTGWLCDFVLYEDSYIRFNSNVFLERFSFVFSRLMILGKAANLNFNVLTTFLNIIVIVGFLYYAKPFSRGFIFILPFFFVDSFMTSQFISFFPAISLFLVAVSLFQQKKIKASILVLLVAMGFHKGIVIALPIYLVAHYFDFKLKYAIVVYLISFFFNNQLWVDFLTEVSALVSFDTGDYYGRYITNIADFYTGSHAIEDKGLSLFYKIRMALINITAMTLFYKFTERNPDFKKHRIFELSVIGLVLGNMTVGVQLVNRYAILFTLFTSVLYAYAFLFCLKKENRNEFIFALCFMGLLLYTNISMFLALDVSNMHFIWEY